MALVEIRSSIKEPVTDGHLHSTEDIADFVVCKSPDKLKLLLQRIQPGKTVYYLSDGDWSMHDLVMELVKKYKPAELFISTYALREFSVRQLILSIDRGEISSVNMLLDYRAPVRTPAVYEMAKMNFNKIYLISIHAKITVIKSDIGSITIVGSANWTKNPKVESGVVSCSAEVAAWYIDNLKKIMADAKIFE